MRGLAEAVENMLKAHGGGGKNVVCTGKNAGVEDLTNIVKMVEYKSESATQIYSKCQIPPHMKKTSCF